MLSQLRENVLRPLNLVVSSRRLSPGTLIRRYPACVLTDASLMRKFLPRRRASDVAIDSRWLISACTCCLRATLLGAVACAVPKACSQQPIQVNSEYSLESTCTKAIGNLPIIEDDR